MDSGKIGSLIRALRVEKGMTQAQLGMRMGVSDKAVSKWERGLGCPDLEVLPSLCAVLGVPMERLLLGEAVSQSPRGRRRSKPVFFVCPRCGNVMVSQWEAELSCCGEALSPLRARQADSDRALTVEVSDDEYYVTTCHAMTKESYVSFVAIATGDTVLLKHLYPEWDLSVRLPRFRLGSLYWYSIADGLMEQSLPKPVQRVAHG